ncbi:MAG: hypothetical protein HRJ53_10640, partial [Acidobacteria bacterium Pan2503]|nr:hypothetical protein [Candidatus Acidoferrum panamensis]
LHRDFDGFGPSRTFALRAAEAHTDWMLVLDADDIFHGTIESDYLDTISADVIECEIRTTSMSWFLPKLLRSNRGWESRGRAHEYYASPIASAPLRTRAFWIEHTAAGSSRANKFERDVALLLADWNEDSTNERTAFYIARSFDDKGDKAQAIEWYRRRIQLPGWVEEAFYSRYRLGTCLIDMGAAVEGCGHLWLAWNMQPHRAEPLTALAEYYRLNQQWQLAFLAAATARVHHQFKGSLFEDTSMDWRIDYELSIAAWYVDEKSMGREAHARIYQRIDIPEPFQSSVYAHQEFYQ